MMEQNFTEFVGLTSFDYLDCADKKGNPFIKVIRYDNDMAGYIEVARIKPRKHECLDGTGELEELFVELKDNNKARHRIREAILDGNRRKDNA
ncbi:hypothetical protein [Listeria booriae]|uniref:Uncharacterized protein n=1 Tax=Listeria booriae TaxID=1552123 RepID=A0A7X1CXU5_9LIST|nr:hypothetical protein [Listeria booriae]MBC1290606.1 hypothetical protein [Listeria booriae]MBC2115702.1 hypothetical protein [Listeria booriae]